jgi:hypothetical protein
MIAHFPLGTNLSLIMRVNLFSQTLASSVDQLHMVFPLYVLYYKQESCQKKSYKELVGAID